MNGSSGLGSLLELEDYFVIRRAQEQEKVSTGIQKFGTMLTALAAFIIAMRVLTGRR